MANLIAIKDGSGTTRNIETIDNTGGGAAAWTHATCVCDSTGATFLPSGDATARAIFVRTATDGTNTAPTMDAIARAGFQELTDGTTGPVFVTPASTRALTTNKALVVRPMVATDGTNDMPTMDAIARAGFQELTDGTNGPVAVKAASTRAAVTDKALVVRPMMPTNGTQDMPSADAVARSLFAAVGDGTTTVTVKAASTAALTTDTALVVRPLTSTDGTNTTPTMDAIARAGFQQLTDGTTGPVFVTPASTAAVAGNKGLVVSLHPTSPATTNADGGGSAGAAGTAGAKSLLGGGVFTAWGSLPAATTGQQVGFETDPAGTQKVGVIHLGTPIYATTSNGAASQIIATLTIPAAKMGFLDGFDIDGLGATAGSAIALTVAGLLGGTITYNLGIPAGATVPVAHRFRFNPPLQCSAVATNIVVTVPSFGSGNTSSSVNAYGHYV